MFHVAGTSRIQVTDANAFVIEDSVGTDCLVVDTTTCETHIDGSLHITSDSAEAFHVHNTDGTKFFDINGLDDSVGISGDLEVSTSSTSAFVVQGITGEDCFVVDTINCQTNVLGTLQAVTIGVSGNVTINGNLTVQGTETTLNTETLTVDDNQITLNGITTANDTNANGGGLHLIGDADYYMIWDLNCIQSGYGVTAAWDFNQNVNVDATLGYYIDCKVVHDESNLLVNTRANSHAGAFYLSNTDVLNPVDGDWRIKTDTSTGGKEQLLFQRYNGATWETRSRIN